MHEELLKVTNELYTVSDELILLTANLCSEGGGRKLVCENEMSVKHQLP